MIRLDGDDFSWVWPVEGDVRDSRSQAYREYNDYWEGRKPLLAPGGVDIFTENSDYGIYEGSPVQADHACLAVGKALIGPGGSV